MAIYLEVGIAVAMQLQAELTLAGLPLQLFIYVGIAAVAVTTLARYVLQKELAEPAFRESRKFRRQLSLLHVLGSVPGLGGNSPVAHCTGFAPRTNSKVPPLAKTSFQVSQLLFQALPLTFRL